MAIPVLAGLRYTFLVYIFGRLVQRLCAWPHLGGFRDTTLPEQVQNHEESSIDAGAGSSRVSRNLAQYDVFLNHRGCDVKRTFVSHLDAALRRVGRDPFLDAKSLVKGDHALNSINDALTGVQVHVAVFSPKYAESEYCLNELFDMLASGKPLIPVFYNVDPEDVQCPENEKGRFAEAFKMWRGKKGRDEDVERWKRALMKAGDITGFTSATYTNEAKLCVDIVEAVLKALPSAPPITPARHLVGLKENSMDVINMLHNMGDNVGVVSIYGMGGIGKTTLAMEVYNQEQSRFEKWCFLKDAKGTTIMDLQKKLVVNLLGRDAEKMAEDYARCLQGIYKKKVLIVVDDVSERKQFEELIPDLNQLAPGSRIILTRRDKVIPNEIMGDYADVRHELYHVLELNYSDSLELFMRQTFKRRSLDEVEESFHDKVREIVKACGGVPLALEVIGRYLASRINIPGCWKEALVRLSNAKDIFTTLKISYDGLEDDERYMFEDIACVLLGHSKDIAMEAWQSTTWFVMPSASFYALIDKCLIKVDVEGMIIMHDLLRDMGRKIVTDRATRKLELRTHIWNPSTATEVLERTFGSSEVVALSLLEIESSSMENQASSSILNKAEAYAKMKDLRYLFLDKCLVKGDFSGWSDRMKWLQWRSFPHQELPTSFNIQNLAILDLANSHTLTHVWARNSEIEFSVAELRMLILNDCLNLKELPHDINRFKKLRVLNLSGCSSLRSLPDTLGDLTELDDLELSNCTGLQNLPPLLGLKKLKALHMSNTALNELSEDFGQLTSLKSAHFAGCMSLVRLPESFGNLSNLEDLNIDYCDKLQGLPSSFCKLGKLGTLRARGTALKELPEDFGQLTSLKSAHFEGCKSLVRLPESFGNLSNLEDLNIDNCDKLQGLPSSFCKLGKLGTLRASGSALEELPEDFGQLTSLKFAHFAWCMSLVRLPESFGNLSNLEDLNIDYCQGLPSSFCKLGRLGTLRARRSRLKELPEDFGKLTSLKSADFVGCKSLVRLPESFGNLSNLEDLNIDYCDKLQGLPSSFCKLGKLGTLRASGSALEELPEDFGQLTSLKSADFEGCMSLVRLPESFGNLSNLEELDIEGCQLLEGLPSSFCKLGKLGTLRASGSALEELPEDFGQLTSLNSAHFGGCKSLVRLPESFGNLSNLEYLDIYNCYKLQGLPSSFCKLGKLGTLGARNSALKELPEDFGQLTSLKSADFVGCMSLVRLRESFGNLSNLEDLNIGGCWLLEELPSSFCKLSKLGTLWASGSRFKGLPEDFGQLTSLKSAHFAGCISLVRLPESFGNLSNLEDLNIDNCDKLQGLPSSFCKLGKLGTLRASGSALEELPEDFGQLTSLKSAHFAGCMSLVRLPESFGNLSNLEDLNIDYCQGLPSSFCKLGRLGTLTARRSRLKELPEDFGKLTSLKSADFVGCKSLVRLPESFGNLSNLEDLNIDYCDKLQGLPSSFCKLGKLGTLRASGSALEELPEDFGQLTSLKSADFGGCKSLVRLPESFGNLSNLEELWIEGCQLLEELPSSFCKLGKLGTLRASGSALEELPEDFGQLSSLKSAHFGGCKSLVRLPESFGNLSNLEELWIEGCQLLEELPSSFCKLGKLGTLRASGSALEELPEDFGQLSSLKSAHFGGCKSLVRLPESFGNLSNLEELWIEGCQLLEELPSSFCKLGKLGTLRARRSRLKELPEDFGKLTSLKSADFVGCKSLVRLPESFGNLSNLEDLNIDYCKKLQGLPSSFCKLGKLGTLRVRGSAWKETLAS
ncbi:hypothetical protein KC19_9G045200 [Ceratodon purpureus]|uniref:TIR domain-containing protein n=1 Tax=Ceratodon purpureus TaxID=3225 RepID=A0A8T0GNQ0_CERPU|nr:hypothetical protein KC19_9G045200 [Ceratodon purpureus]